MHARTYAWCESAVSRWWPLMTWGLRVRKSPWPLPGRIATRLASLAIELEVYLAHLVERIQRGLGQ